MARGSKSSDGGNGIGDSGIFGGIGLGTVVNCPASDTSMYCSLMKFIQVAFYLFIAFVVLYFAYKYFSKRRR